MSGYVFGLLTAMVVAFIATPYVKKLAIKIGAVDAPNDRKVHTKIMPRMGGLAIFIGFVVALFIFLKPLTNEMLGIFIGGTIVLITGILDDKYQLSPKWKLLGQIIGTAVVVIGFGLKIGVVNLPFGDVGLDFSTGWLAVLAVPITMVWIIGVTNAINLIDGLDGLSAGVSGIATATMGVMAIIMKDTGVAMYCFILLGAIIGFLYFNFHPAKIFMGDTGALFLGFNLAALSIMGFKEAVFVSFIIPIVVLGVPLWDTFFAIVRRILNNKPISSADKGHLHHCLLNMGLSHRTTVITIYGMSAFFGGAAILLTKVTNAQHTIWMTLIILAVLGFVIHMVTEIVGLVGRKHRPILNAYERLKLKVSNSMRRGQ